MGDELEGGPIGGKRPGNDRVNGGGGPDLIYGGTGVQGEDVGNDELLGGGGDDHIEADDGKDELEGGGGDDALRAGLGDDKLSGGPGDDAMIGAGGNDELFGDDGADSLLGDGLTGDPPGVDACDGDSSGVTGRQRRGHRGRFLRVRRRRPVVRFERAPVHQANVEILLRVERASEPISGSLARREGAAEAFRGWLQLMAAIEAARRRGRG